MADVELADVAMKPIRRLLVANRGEIARRIMRTAHAMGIGTVAIYSDGDADAPFVHEADTGIALGGRTATETYLDIEKVLAHTGGNVSAAARLLKMHRTQLQRVIERLAIDVSRFALGEPSQDD